MYFRAQSSSRNRLAIVARSITSTNRALLEAGSALGLDALVVAPEEAARRIRTGDVVLGRLDVRTTLDGPESGLEVLRGLEDSGVLVLNRADALLSAHDKLMTALKLGAHSVPHPRTAHVGGSSDPAFEFPVVVKPRFGSWGRDVSLCKSRSELERRLGRLGRKPWFRRQGALVQELVQPQGYDLRILVAAGEVVGAVKRVAAPGEWRTNVALGGSRCTADPPARACVIALGAAAAIGADLVGVDLLPDGDGGWVVIELNGAVDFTPDYGVDAESVFERVVRVLAGPILPEVGRSARAAMSSRRVAATGSTVPAPAI